MSEHISADSSNKDIFVESKSDRIEIQVSHEMVAYWSNLLREYAESIEKLAEDTQQSIERGITEKIQADWSESDSDLKSYIKNKPYIPQYTDDLTNDSGFITVNDVPVYTAGSGIEIENYVISNTKDTVNWGNIQGNLEDQNDLMEYLANQKEDLETQIENLELLDAEEVFGAIADKTDITQATQASMPSERFVNLTVGTSGTLYSAPADGYFCFVCRTQNATGGYQSWITPSYGGRIFCSAYGYSNGGGIVSVSAGQTICLEYESSVTDRSLKFVYAEGAQND